MSGFTEALGMTEMEKDEFRLARRKLYEKLVEVTGQVEEAMQEAEDTGEVYGVKDMLYGLSVDTVAKAFTEANAPVVQAAKRKER